MIIVDNHSWHARLYRWWYRQKYGQRYDYHTHSYVDINPDRSNLCPYMRAVLFWSWMRWLFLGGKVGKLPVPAITWLLLGIEVPRWLGIVSYDAKRLAILVEASVIGITLFAAAIFGIIHVHEKLGFFNGGLVPAKAVRNKASSFKELIAAYFRPAHDRICPEITFQKD